MSTRALTTVSIAHSILVSQRLFLFGKTWENVPDTRVQADWIRAKWSPWNCVKSQCCGKWRSWSGFYLSRCGGYSSRSLDRCRIVRLIRGRCSLGEPLAYHATIPMPTWTRRCSSGRSRCTSASIVLSRYVCAYSVTGDFFDSMPKDGEIAHYRLHCCSSSAGTSATTGVDGDWATAALLPF